MTQTADASTAVSRPEPAGPWRKEGLDVVRAASGGLLFGVPLLYTMEVWWTGSRSQPPAMALVVVLLLIPVFVLNQTGGFRETPDHRVRDAVADTVEAVALGLVVTTVVLVLLREITTQTPLAAALGKVVYESIPFCLGIGVARLFLHGDRDGDDGDDGDDGAGPGDGRNARDDRGTGDEDDDDDDDTGRSRGTLADLGATSLGAVFIALSIAPTDEVPTLASAMTPAWLLVVVGASLLVSYAIVFVAGFTNQDERHAHRGIFQRPLTETIVSYLLALVMSLLLLWCFQRGFEPWTDVVTRVVVLGLPAAVGGAAGRLAI